MASSTSFSTSLCFLHLSISLHQRFLYLPCSSFLLHLSIPLSFTSIPFSLPLLLSALLFFFLSCVFLCMLLSLRRFQTLLKSLYDDCMCVSVLPTVNVKWGKEKFDAVELNTEEPPMVFKAQLFALTGVQPDRQKVMVKGGTLKVY